VLHEIIRGIGAGHLAEEDAVLFCHRRDFTGEALSSSIRGSNALAKASARSGVSRSGWPTPIGEERAQRGNIGALVWAGLRRRRRAGQRRARDSDVGLVRRAIDRIAEPAHCDAPIRRGATGIAPP
jgi:hypothetical protein